MNMDTAHINKQLSLLALKNKLFITIKWYLINTQQTHFSFLYQIFDLLRIKYIDDFNLIEQGFRCNIQNNGNEHFNMVMLKISSNINNCNNENLLKDLLNSIDTGINYQLEYRQDNLEKLIVENTSITIETGNTVNRIQENFQDLL